MKPNIVVSVEFYVEIMNKGLECNRILQVINKDFEFNHTSLHNLCGYLLSGKDNWSQTSF